MSKKFRERKVSGKLIITRYGLDGAYIKYRTRVQYIPANLELGKRARKVLHYDEIPRSISGVREPLNN